MATGVALLDAAPAEAEDTGVCTLLTRDEAGDLLGAKVVKTTKKTSAANGAQECTYTTRKAQKRFKRRNLKISLELTVQPVTDELRSKLQIAIWGNTAVAAKLQNYRGVSSKFRSVSEGAVRAALPRLGRLTPAPSS
jgi:hypothetical protein